MTTPRTTTAISAAAEPVAADDCSPISGAATAAGFTPVPDWLTRRRDVSHGGKLMWSRLARYASGNPDGKAFPSIRTLGREIGVQRGQAMVYLKELERKGLLAVERRNGCRSRYRPVHDHTPVQHGEPVQDTELSGSGSCTGPVQDHAPSSEDTRKTQGRKQPCTGGYTRNFLSFWEAYPRKTGKRAAFSAWKTLKGRPQVSGLIEAVNRQRNSDQWRREDGRFIPHPATWLRQGRGDDEPATTAAGNGQYQQTIVVPAL